MLIDPPNSDLRRDICHRHHQPILRAQARRIRHRQRHGVRAVVTVGVRGRQHAGRGVAIAKIPENGVPGGRVCPCFLKEASTIPGA